MLSQPGLRVPFSISEFSETPPNAGLVNTGLPSASVLKTLPALGPIAVTSELIDSAEYTAPSGIVILMRTLSHASPSIRS